MAILIPFKTAGDVLPRLAPDSTWPSSLSGSTGYVEVTGINAVGSLTTALSLTGKYAIDYLRFDNLASESMTFKLTVDGVVIWNDTFTPSSTLRLFGLSNVGATGNIPSRMLCEDSFLMEVQTTADTSVHFYYVARPVL